ncbi:hypothetical protein H2200_008259 [Cladophialophora chaetospira]|uniref:U1-type domain-containing protein n=1 Tax=Cladophialophora chaetospira TaxID=386627 RepID=A0AA38X5L8_9EURO|nr:hypothetical protein H2200_008259 [Cladophialophora chaetospira]
MADVRALLAAERQSRRISHPHLSYTKSGILLCSVCNLNVKSEALWAGHLKSANHRKNVAAQATRQASLDSNTGKGVKRKIEDVEEEQEEWNDADTDARKKPKSRPESTVVEAQDSAEPEPVLLAEEVVSQEPEQPAAPLPTSDSARPVNGSLPADVTVDEDEWAAFEREVVPLATEKPKPDYSSATIVAAPVTADQVKAQEDEDRRRRLETEAEDEREDELGKMADEFEVMEEMEERVRKLRGKRDALRSVVKPEEHKAHALLEGEDKALAARLGSTESGVVKEDDDDDDDEDEDDWYS